MCQAFPKRATRLCTATRRTPHKRETRVFFFFVFHLRLSRSPLAYPRNALTPVRGLTSYRRESVSLSGRLCTARVLYNTRERAERENTVGDVFRIQDRTPPRPARAPVSATRTCARVLYVCERVRRRNAPAPRVLNMYENALLKSPVWFTQRKV